jgi:hypothetical protein
VLADSTTGAGVAAVVGAGAAASADGLAKLTDGILFPLFLFVVFFCLLSSSRWLLKFFDKIGSRPQVGGRVFCGP